ncbi:MAG: pyruvate synthase subunit PorB [Candidatus Woesearchaeota archaeon]
MKEINKIPTEELFAQGHRACAGCGPAIAMRHALKAAGKNTIVIQATGCMEVVSTPYPQTAWKIPWIHAAFENAASVASGVERAVKHQKKKTNILIIGGDGGTFDIGFQALSGAAERGHDFCYICYDNGAYMNTGIQRSGATPHYAATTTTPHGHKIHGKQEKKKNMPLIMAAHGAYVATANLAFPQDFIQKVKKGLEHKGPAYIQIYSPCPTGWRHLSDMTIDIAKSAYQARVTPLYEIEDGYLTFTKKPNNAKHIEDYLKTMGRFKGLKPKEIMNIQQDIDEEFKRLEKLEECKVQIM